MTAHPPEAERLSGVNYFFNLKPKQERIIQEEIQSGLRSSDETLDHAVAAVREKEHKSKMTTLQKNLPQFLTGMCFSGGGVEPGNAEGLA